MACSQYPLTKASLACKKELVTSSCMVYSLAVICAAVQTCKCTAAGQNHCRHLHACISSLISFPLQYLASHFFYQGMAAVQTYLFRNSLTSLQYLMPYFLTGQPSGALIRNPPPPPPQYLVPHVCLFRVRPPGRHLGCRLHGHRDGVREAPLARF